MALIPNLCQFASCFSDNCCLAGCFQSPAAGTPVGPGIHPITITLTDCSHNTTITNCGLDFVVTAPSNCCVTPPTNMVLWLPFDETSGATTANYIPGGNPGTLLNGPTHNLGSYVANSLCFDAVNDYVQVASYPALGFGTGKFSVDAWVKPNTTGTIRGIVEHREVIPPLPTVRGYVLLLWSDNTIAFQMGDGSGGPNVGWQNFNSTLQVPLDGQWHHVAVTVQRPGAITAYLDCAPMLMGSSAPYPGSVTPPANIPLYVGGDPTPNSGFNGCIDEVELSRRALRADEIKAIYDARCKGKCRIDCYTGKVNILECWLGGFTNTLSFYNPSSVKQTFQWSLQPLPVGPGCTVAGINICQPRRRAAKSPAHETLPLPSLLAAPARGIDSRRRRARPGRRRHRESIPRAGAARGLGSGRVSWAGDLTARRRGWQMFIPARRLIGRNLFSTGALSSGGG